MSSWSHWYEQLRREFHLDPAADQTATDVLSSLLRGRASPLRELKHMLTGRVALVFGAGPSLEEDVEALEALLSSQGVCTVAADGASVALVERDKLPDIICSDLDSDPELLASYNSEHSFLVLHSHSDNVEVVEEWTPKLEGKVIGSTQVLPRPHVYNFGGFTDGDRAAFLAAKYARAVLLFGMDFGTVVGRYSKPPFDRHLPANNTKAKKLAYARLLIDWLRERSDVLIVNLTSCAEDAKELLRWKLRGG